MNDPYATLGIPTGASQDEIKKTYRALARKYHPDSRQGGGETDPRTVDRFREIAAAYALLSDPKKRAAFDNGDIDAAGRPLRTRRAAAGSAWRDAAHAYRQRETAWTSRHSGGTGGEKAGDGGESRFDAFFRNRAGVFKSKGANVAYTLTSDFVEAAMGGVRHIKIANGKRLKVLIPPGTENGQILRLKGQGMVGSGGGENGDAHVEIQVLDDPVFSRKGHDVYTTVPISLPEAVLGAKIDIPTIDGMVTLGVPPGSNSGSKLRLKEKGIPKSKDGGKGGPRGDHYVILSLALPPKPDAELTKFVEKWAAKHPYDPRAKSK
ncbi:DnaJ C-terminal domain-containing protein [Varunaivibrio sulfuroxidans]|uniref:DnaJ-like protein n=1 Tax=Varunaivibrio sulfuroxidans TaxID=1773489 RepID=A0A4R3J503_9PROT|nr:DnaJ C-terminal domain-containing protein [Varunaivibrio sulfuroxidans]TCS60342.1 DnaJ-like protein [Varunaivibrio sulfuroxidans]WES30971.1 DnaJ C-terminal domain-containing protein [Varunaivibrio sulfuroxidans]